MGSLMLAAAGAIGGLGQGITEVGQQAQREQLVEKQNDLATAREQTLVRLRAAEELKNQQTVQQSGFTEQEKMHGVEHGEAVAAAGATRTFQTQQEAAKEAAALERARTIAKSRTDVAGINAASRSANSPANRQNSLFKSGGMLTLPGGQDKYGTRRSGTKVPMYIGPGGVRLVKVPGTDDPENPGAAKYAPLGANGEMPSVTGLSRAPQADVQDASDNPDRVGAFFNKYGFVTQGHITSGQRPTQSSPGAPFKLPKGAAYTPPPEASASSSGSSADNAADAQDDNYAMYGDLGHQPEDDMPAQ